jgi:predicted aspartyl protease
VPVKTGSIVNGHPYIEILVSPDNNKSAQQTALVDTGFSGVISLPVESARLMGLVAHATTFYTLANGQVSEPVPLADGYACVEGDAFVPGLFSISENASVVVGMDFLARCGKVLIIAPNEVVIVDAIEYGKWLK